MVLRCSHIPRVIENIKQQISGAINIDCILSSPVVDAYESYCLRTRLIGHAPLWGKTKTGQPCRAAPSVINSDSSGKYRNGENKSVSLCPHEVTRKLPAIMMQHPKSTLLKNCRRKGYKGKGEGKRKKGNKGKAGK